MNLTIRAWLIALFGCSQPATAQFRPYAVDGSYYLPTRQRGELAPPNWLYKQMTHRPSENSSPFFGPGSNNEDSRAGGASAAPSSTGMGAALGDIIDGAKDLSNNGNSNGDGDDENGETTLRPSVTQRSRKTERGHRKRRSPAGFHLTPSKQRPIFPDFLPITYHIIH